MNAQQTADIIERIDAEAYKRHGYASRPTGANYCMLLLEIAHGIVENVAPADMTDEMLDVLTWDNYHTARQACEIVREILRKENAK